MFLLLDTEIGTFSNVEDPLERAVKKSLGENLMLDRKDEFQSFIKSKQFIWLKLSLGLSCKKHSIRVISISSNVFVSFKKNSGGHHRAATCVGTSRHVAGAEIWKALAVAQKVRERWQVYPRGAPLWPQANPCAVTTF